MDKHRNRQKHTHIYNYLQIQIGSKAKVDSEIITGRYTHTPKKVNINIHTKMHMLTNAHTCSSKHTNVYREMKKIHRIIEEPKLKKNTRSVI